MIEGAQLAALGVLQSSRSSLFVVVLLFPFYWMMVTTVRPDAELYRPWMRAELHAVLDRSIRRSTTSRYLLEETLFSTWMLNTLFISVLATAISLFCGLLAGYALSRLKFPFAGSLGTGIFITYLVPQTLLFIPLADIIRNFHLGDTPWALILTYPTFLIPFCTWLLMGYFKAIPQRARGMRAHRRRHALEGDGLHHLPGRGAGHPLGRDLRLYPVVERVHLRARLSVLAGARRRSPSASRRS